MDVKLDVRDAIRLLQIVVTSVVKDANRLLAINLFDEVRWKEKLQVPPIGRTGLT